MKKTELNLMQRQVVAFLESKNVAIPMMPVVSVGKGNLQDYSDGISEERDMLIDSLESGVFKLEDISYGIARLIFTLLAVSCALGVNMKPIFDELCRCMEAEEDNPNPEVLNRLLKGE